MFSPKKILVPTDFSQYSDKALSVAVDMARQYKSRIWLLHVINIIHQCSVDYCIDADMLGQLEEESIKSAKEKFQQELQRIPDSKGIDIITDIRKGTPYEEILREQSSEAIDLIVVASHGSTGLLHYLMGNVAGKITKYAKCPVLLIRSA